ncbi:MAG: hypothetical protein ACF8XB_13765 [Planctomycetota bacterium JB042]
MAGVLVLAQGHAIAGVGVVAAGVLLRVFGPRIADRLAGRHAECEDGVCRTVPPEETPGKPKEIGAPEARDDS